ncbi:hypothetical protein ACLB2K_047531 [Fragaria x ananassa]
MLREETLILLQLQHQQREPFIVVPAKVKIGPFVVNGDRSESEKRVVLFVYDTSTNLKLDETIVDSASGCIYTTRNSVRTLGPDGFVEDGIITLFADYLWQEQRGVGSVYFTPYFSRKTKQFSKEISEGHVVDGLSTKGLGVKRFDNDIPTCKMIFIPMNDTKHWFLLVVRIDLQVAEIWDSLGCSRRRKNQCKTILQALDMIYGSVEFTMRPFGEKKKIFAEYTINEQTLCPK